MTCCVDTQPCTYATRHTRTVDVEVKSDPSVTSGSEQHLHILRQGWPTSILSRAKTWRPDLEGSTNLWPLKLGGNMLYIYIKYLLNNK
jgi:hypothetical protein